MVITKKWDLSRLKLEFSDHQVIKHIVLDDFLDINLAKSLNEEHKSIKEGLWLDYSHISQKKTGITVSTFKGVNGFFNGFKMATNRYGFISITVLEYPIRLESSARTYLPLKSTDVILR